MDKKIILSEEQEKKLIDFYQTHSVNETATEFGLSIYWVGQFIKSRGLSHDRQEVLRLMWDKRGKEVDEQEVINYYLEPQSNKRVKLKFGISDNRLYRILEKHGIPRRTLEESDALRKKTNCDRYGVENPLQSKEILEKRQNTNMEKYGVKEVGGAPEIIAKRKQTCVERFGTEFPSKTQEIKDKVRETVFKKFGVPAVFLLPEVNKKKEEIVHLKYGGDSPFCSAEIRAKSKASMLDRYGVTSTMLSPELRKKQSNSAKESKLEKRFREFLSNNGFNFTQQLVLSNGDLLHSFDFAVYDDDELKILIDCDGIYYHGYTNDHDGKTVNLDADSYRQLLVPNGVKFITVIEHHEEEVEKELFSLLKMSYDEYVQSVFDWCREVEFPYPTCNDSILNSTFAKLKKASISPYFPKARYGDKIMLNFHPSLFHANRRGCLSPYDAWQNDELLIKCIKNRIIYKGSNLDRSKVLAGLSVTKIAPRVSLFSAYLAKYLISKYLNEFNLIFDPFSGYSGRMLGACVCDKEYIGHDINQTTVDESNKIIQSFHLNANVSCVDTLVDSGEFPCLFTCPPYNDKERWGSESVVKSCDDWIDICLNNYKCNSYLFVVDDTSKYSDYVVEEIVNKSHFGTNKELVILINKA